jgi:MFS transporter, SP family, arabinose:H+ symporter
MVITFQLNIVLGILVAYVSNYLLKGGTDDWRWMLGVVAVPSLLFALLMLTTPETPRWLLLYRKDEAAARAVLALTDTTGGPGIDAEVQAIQQSAEAGGHSKETFFSKKYSFPILLAFLFALFNQISGINAVIYYAPRIFEMTGAGKDTALLSTAGIGVINMLSTLLGWFLIDRFGRRALMYIGSVGYIVSLALMSYTFQSDDTSNMMWYVFAFIAAHAIGQGSVIWVFISEIFPNAVRASGMAWGSLTHWVFAAIITNIFPFCAEKWGGAPIFGFFAVAMVFQLLYVWRLMPETKGVSLEDLQKRLL